MTMTREEEFFKEWEEASWHVTYADENAPEKYLLKTGLVMTLHFWESSQKKEAVTQILRRFYTEFSDKLKCCAWNDGTKYRERPATQKNFEKCMTYLESLGPILGLGCEFYSAESFDDAGDYGIRCFCMDAMRESAWDPKPVGYLQITLPVEYIKHQSPRFEKWLLDCADALEPLCGVGGLGFHPAREGSGFQDLEYEGATLLSGLDVGIPLGEDSSWDGFKTVNWYTVLDQRFVNKLGGQDVLTQRLNEMGLEAIAYAHGLIVKAGDWPSIGWIEKGRGMPAPYVLANHILRPVRAPKIMNLHYGSIAGEVRFVPETTKMWQQRFDVPDEEIPYYIEEMRKLKSDLPPAA